MNYEQLEKVKVLTTKEIVNRLEQITSSSSDELLAELIKDMSALLISFNTESREFPSGNEIIQTINSLIKPLIDTGFINNKTEYFEAEGFIRPTILLYPPEIETSIDHLIIRTRAKMAPQEISIPILHAHLDTTKLLGKLGNLNTYIQRDEVVEESIIYGRGTIDMKSQVAVIIISIYILRSLGEKSPLVILTTDEEMNCPTSFDLLNSIYPKNICIDLEPSTPDKIVLEIPSAILMILKFDDVQDSTKLIEIKNQLELLLNEFHPEESYYNKILVEKNNIAISTIPKMKPKETVSFSYVFRQKVRQVVEQYFSLYQLDSGIMPDFNSTLTEDKLNSISKVLKRRKKSDKVTSANILTNLVEGNDITAILYHHMWTALSMTLGVTYKNVFITGPRSIAKDRHSEEEGLLLADDILLLKNLVEMLLDAQPIFKEA